MQKEDDYEDYESWEDDYNYIQNEDYKGLIQYRIMVAEKNPNDIYDQWSVGEAYIFDKQYDKALEYLKPLYYKEPDDLDIPRLILEALYGLGKTEKDFAWIKMPKVINLSDEVIAYCYDLLKNKRKARSIYDIHTELFCEGYITFSEKELLRYLIDSGRFECINGDEIKVKRK